VYIRLRDMPETVSADPILIKLENY